MFDDDEFGVLGCWNLEEILRCRVSWVAVRSDDGMERFCEIKLE